MAIEQYIEEARVQNGLLEGQKSMEKWMSSPEAITDPDNNSSAGFDCNICLDTVQDPVVTLCGHIYCWPCIYKWLQFQSNSTENQDQKQPQCPVCKAEVSDSTLVPLYGRGRTSKASKSKAPQLGIVIPKRPLGPDLSTPRTPNTASTPQFAHQIHQHHHGYSYQQQVYNYPPSPMLSPGGTTMAVVDPVMRIFSETVHARVFGDSVTNIYAYPNSYNLVGSTSPRIRRYMMQADKSLNRLSIFLFCCLLICLLLF
ncbi:RING membrane-anchor 1 [Hibiscus trionum]|uniref:E3 ubiquitin-protein ligase RMA n=1 Tax=Hibiscus trionum TaxID=183268 RepID=A0A9W7J731_HIBTR|nr:RING membrane-anchor 1 [Hibiscus trionum]